MTIKYLQSCSRGLLGTALALWAVTSWLPVSAAPKAELWQRWVAHEPGSSASIDHQSWDRLLSRYVTAHGDGINRVAYARVSDIDRRVLANYIAGLAAKPISRFARDEQLAYWINLYNALTVKLVLDHYPVDSIRDIKFGGGWFRAGPWRSKVIQIEGEELSLDDIEHRILRPIWKDPRLHYALNCAALGCPNLHRAAYTPSNMDRVLEIGAHAFINHSRGARVSDGRLYVSSIYEWFQEDFGDSDQGVIDHLLRYASPELKSALKGIGRIADDAYDWTLNDADAAAKVD